MRVLVTGATGQIGYDVMKELKNRNLEAVGLGSIDCDITVTSEVLRTIEAVKPDAIVHCVGFQIGPKCIS